MEIQTILVWKKLGINKAREIASDIMKRQAPLVRSTAGYYRFRNIPKQRFLQNSFRTHHINENVMLVLGKLK
jgi:hypothetical protein